jgi:hypothetical protein
MIEKHLPKLALIEAKILFAAFEQKDCSEPACR